MTIDPYAALQTATRAHRMATHSDAYTFEDGPALTQVAARSGAVRMLELGTALGYTACCLAAARPDARVDTIEGDPLRAGLARDNIAVAGLADRVTVHQGDFMAVLARLTAGYGLVFFDGYAPDLSMLNAIIDRLSPGGTLVCANLGLAGVNERQRLLATLDDPSQFTQLEPIEKGGTVVRRRLR
ncbi:MAG: class I SAM-dependent methyltransferase [bacterium]